MVMSEYGKGPSSGWTLIELTIVMSLVTVLAGIALVGYSNAITRSKEAVLKEDLFQMRDAINQYYADKGHYPDSLENLVTNKYLRAVPADPLTGSPDTWEMVLANFDPASPFVQGIFDVKSGSEGVALDGTFYVDW